MRKKSKYLLSKLILVFLCFTFACTSKKRPEKTLRINTLSEPPTLDIRKALDNVSAFIIKICFDGLTRIDPENNIKLSIAKSYTLSEDKKTYTFKLRNTTWSNGEKLTAHDFESTWKSRLDPEFPSANAYVFYPIKNARNAKNGVVGLDKVGVSALDDSTLVVELEYPMENFLELVSGYVFYPFPEKIAANNLNYIESKSVPYISNGPFLIEQWKTNQHIIFKKNSTYWDESVVKLENIKLSFVLDQSTELSMYEQNEIDYCGSPLSSLPSDAVKSIKDRDDFYSYDISGIYFYIFNTEKFPLNNANIRKSLALSINRKNLVDHVLQINHGLATSLVPKTIDSLNKNFFIDSDIAKARQYFEKGLKELDITREQFPTLEISFNTEPNLHFKIAQAIQQQWNKSLGIKTRLRNTEWKVYLDELAHKKFDIARMGFGSSISDPKYFIEQFAYQNIGFNFSNWKNNSYTDYYHKALYLTDTNERLKALDAAEKIFLDDMPIAPIYFYKNNYLKKSHLKNLALPHSGSIDFKWAYIDEKKRS